MNSSRRPSTQYGKRARRSAARKAPSTPPLPSTSTSPTEDEDELWLQGDQGTATPPQPRSATQVPGDVGAMTSRFKSNLVVEVVLPSPSTLRKQSGSRLTVKGKGAVQDEQDPLGKSGGRDTSPGQKRKSSPSEGGGTSGSEDGARKRPKLSSSSTGPSTRTPQRILSPSKSSTIFTRNPNLIPVVEIISPRRRPAGSLPRSNPPIVPAATESNAPSGRLLKTASAPHINNLFNTTAPSPSAESSPSSSRPHTPKIAQTMSKRMLLKETTPLKAPMFSPPKPPEKVHDVMAMFIAPTSSTSPRKSGLAKRMLSRTGTDLKPPDGVPPLTPTRASSTSGVDTPDSGSTPTRTTSLPTIPSPTKGFVPSHQDEAPHPSSTVARPGHRTYAKSRSYLIELPGDSALEAGDSQSSVPEQVRDSYKDLRARWGIDGSDDDPQGLALPNDLRSMTEMRNKGENRRFLDEIGYLFEGLDPQLSTAVKRLSAIELVAKFSDLEFVRKARVADVIGRSWDILRKAGAGSVASNDCLLDVCLAAFLAFVSRDPKDILDCCRKDDFFEVLDRLLEQSGSGLSDIFAFMDGLMASDEARRKGLGKSERKLLSELGSVIQKSRLLPNDAPIVTNRALLSFVLASIPQQSIRILVVNRILSSTLEVLAAIPKRLGAFTAGLDVMPPQQREAPDILHLHYCLKTLETALFGGRVDVRELVDSRTEELSVLLVSACIFCEFAMASKPEGTKKQSLVDFDSVAAKCLTSCLRTLIYLTEAREWCDAILNGPWSPLSMIFRVIVLATSNTSHSAQLLTRTTRLREPVSDKDQKETLAPPPHHDKGAKGEEETASATAKLDLLCYALALLTHILQNDERALDLVRDMGLSPACTRRPRCAKACVCAGRVNGLEQLTSLYNIQAEQSKDVENAEAHFLRGHLAVMLGLLCGRKPNRAIILAALPNPAPSGGGASSASSEHAKFDALISAIREFISFYGNLAEKLAALANNDSGDGEASPGDFSNQGHTNDTALRRKGVSGPFGSSSDKDNEMANDVIKTLEKLRDGH